MSPIQLGLPKLDLVSELFRLPVLGRLSHIEDAKQFSGACPVLEVHTGLSAGRLEDSGIPKEGQIVTERSERASEVTIKSLWLQLDGRVDFGLSWNKGVGKLMFGLLLNPASGRKILRI